MNSSKGFTFLEMVITLAIMAVLTVASTQAIQNGLRAKTKLQSQLDDMSQVRDALRVIERDVNLAYHYVDLEAEFKKIVLDESKKGGTSPGSPSQPNDPQNPNNLAQTPQYLQQWLRLDPERVDPTTHFKGSNEEMYFPTMNASRITDDVPQAEFIKVGYYLASCSKPNQKEAPKGKCLLRRSSNIIEGDITKGGEASILLENVTEFKLRYIGKGKQDWNNDWDSKVGDAVTKDNFPEAVEISLTIVRGKDKQEKKVSMQIVASVHFPNNRPKATTGVTP